MTIDIEGIKASVDIAQVIGQRVELTRKGNYWQGLCPFHGERTPSFQVVPHKRMYHCHGCGANGDVFDFLREIDGLTLTEAAEALGGPLPVDRRPPLPPPPSPWVSSKPPADRPRPDSFEFSLMGKLVATWCYRDADGSPLGYVCRYEPPEGGKNTIAWTWGTDGTASARWAPKGWVRPRPLYGLDRLADRPDAQVIIGEGEKTVNAAGQLMPALVAVGWPGGVNAVMHADWSPVAGRRVVLVPDADDPGRKCMEWLAEHLAGMGCAVKLVEVEQDRPKGWDLADALAEGWDADRTLAWIKSRVKEWKREEVLEEVQGAAPVLAGLEQDEAMAGIDEGHADAGDHAPAPPPERTDDGGGAADAPGDDTKTVALRRTSDIALAEQFAAGPGRDWRYVAEFGKWYEWVGDRWQRDELGRVRLCAARFLKDFEQRKGSGAAYLTPAGRRALCSARTVEAVIGLAASQPTCATPHGLLDAEPHVLGVPGGAVDLRTGEMRPADRDRLVTKQAACSPKPGAPVRWLAFLHQVLMGRQDQIDFLQRFAGYCLIGKLYEPGLAFLHGGGGNGKSVALDVLRGVMADYAVSADFSVFASQSGGERHSTEIASLAGARLIVAEEGNESQQLNDARVQKMTGGGRMRARFMHKDEFEFDLIGKIIIATNHKPALATVGESMRRRVNMVPFDYTVPENQRDQRLGEKLREEYPQILQWMIDGCLKWADAGLSPPESIRAASRGYIQSQDVLADFLDECCVVGGEASEFEPAVYRAYKEWCTRGGESSVPMRKLMEQLAARPGLNRKKVGGIKSIEGLRLRSAV